MSLDLVFSWFADGGAWPEHPGVGAAVVDRAVVGPMRLLDHIETMLGLGAPAVAGVKRIAVYRRKLESAGPKMFWTESFEKDSWSTTRELLNWRDELVEAGWLPGATVAARRITDLAAAEHAGPALPAGIAGRLRAVIATLIDRPQLPLASIETIDERTDLPVGWRQLLEALEACGVAVVPRPEATAVQDNDLSRLLAPISEKNLRPEIAGDGTTCLLTADTEIVAAEALAGWLAESKDGNAGLVFVLGRDSALLDNSLHRVGLPRLGRSAVSPHRALLQILPLAFALAWNPPSPNSLLDFLLLPVNPLPRWASNMLASCVAEAPGVGGPLWNQTFDDIEKRFAEKSPEEPAEKRTEAVSRWRAFVEPERHDPVAGIPRAAARAIAGRIASWAHSRFGMSDDALFLALGTAADDLVAAIDATESETLDRLLIERMIEQVVGAGVGDPAALAEAAPWRAVTHPGAIWGPAHTVVWWNFADQGEINSRSVWDREEREALKEAGFPLDDPSLSIRLVAASWERPIRHAQKKLLLVRPAAAAGEELKAHPLWHSIVAGRSGLEKRIGVRAETILQNPAPQLMGRILSRQKVAAAPLPLLRAQWTVPEESIGPRKFESASSLSSLLSCPFAWTLNYAARLRPSNRQSLPREDALFGNLAHKIAEDLLSPGAPPDPLETVKLARTRLEELLPQMAATLLLPGAARDLASVRQAIPEALGELARFLALNKLKIIATEQGFEDCGALDNETGIIGAIDLVAKDEAGRPIVIDLKWQRTDKRRRAEIADGVAIQLAVYAKHTDGAKQDVSTGYFMLRQKRFVTGALNFSGSVVAVEGQTPRETWQKVGTSWRKAMNEIAEGTVRATFDQADVAQARFEDAILLTPPKCDYCNYATLCGR